jgi:ribonucleoside-diphosphate reductase alpha chain
VAVQAAVQRWTDSAISKTVNAPQDYSIEQTKQLYTLMYDSGCKGGTIYRDGSRDEQILATDHKKLGKDASDQVESKKKDAAVTSAQPKEVMSVSGDNVQIKLAPRTRPEMVAGMTYKMPTAYGNLYITVNEDEQGPVEVFATMGKAGGFFSAQTEAITRLISLALRSNVAIEEIIDQIKGIRSPDVSFGAGGVVFSLPDAVAKVLERHIKREDKQMALSLPDAKPSMPVSEPKKDEVKILEDTLQVKEDVVMQTVSENKVKTNGHLTYQKTEKVSIANLGNAPVCPSCANMMILAEGCMKCDMCGYSKCG